jgi:hypothetical protein
VTSTEPCVISHKRIVYALSGTMGKQITARSPASEVMPAWGETGLMEEMVS